MSISSKDNISKDYHKNEHMESKWGFLIFTMMTKATNSCKKNYVNLPFKKEGKTKIEEGQ